MDDVGGRVVEVLVEGTNCVIGGLCHGRHLSLMVPSLWTAHV